MINQNLQRQAEPSACYYTAKFSSTQCLCVPPQAQARRSISRAPRLPNMKEAHRSNLAAHRPRHGFSDLLGTAPRADCTPLAQPAASTSPAGRWTDQDDGARESSLELDSPAILAAAGDRIDSSTRHSRDYIRRSEAERRGSLRLVRA